MGRILSRDDAGNNREPPGPVALAGELGLRLEDGRPVVAIQPSPVALAGELRLLPEKPGPAVPVQLAPLVTAVGELRLRGEQFGPVPLGKRRPAAPSGGPDRFWTSVFICAFLF